jgi:hypothetical protein
MSGDDRSKGALELLAHFVPQQVLQELHESALSFQRDEQFRIYLLRRFWLIIPVGFISVLIGSACAIGAVAFLFRFVDQPAPGWLASAILGFGAVIWLVSIISQLYVLLAWLHRRAFAQARPSGIRRDAASLFLIAVFVAFPMLLFALVSAQAALILVAAGVCAPVVLSLLDRR